MKKNSLQKIIFALLIVTSLASYIYLNTVEVDLPSNSTEIKAELEEEEKLDDQEMLLPDVKFIKHILEKSKKIIPSS